MAIAALAVAFFALPEGWQPAGGIALLALLGSGSAWLIRREIRESDRMRMELLGQRRLEAKSRYYEAIVDQSANIIFTIDEEHRILKFNSGSQRAFGLSQSEAVGREVHGLFADPAAISALLVRMSEHGLAELPEIRTRSGNGESIWVSATVTPMPARDGGLGGAVFNCNDITASKALRRQLQEANERLLRLSLTDGLTGLYNLRHLHSELSRFMRTRQRYPQRPLSLALIDLDHFKAINDLQGHAEGDRILQRVAGILKQEMREGLDGAFRVGGDEFLLLLPDTPRDGALTIGERILAEFRKSPQGPVSLSIGIAADEGDPPGTDVDEAIRSLRARADAAMYRAKQSGGNRILAEELPTVPVENPEKP